MFVKLGLLVDSTRGGRCSDFGGMDILSEVVGEGLAVVGVMPFLSAS